MKNFRQDIRRPSPDSNQAPTEIEVRSSVAWENFFGDYLCYSLPRYSMRSLSRAKTNASEPRTCHLHAIIIHKVELGDGKQ
jgi:hypothetical protein